MCGGGVAPWRNVSFGPVARRDSRGKSVVHVVVPNWRGGQCLSSNVHACLPSPSLPATARRQRYHYKTAEGFVIFREDKPDEHILRLSCVG